MQAEIIQTVLDGKDCLALMPTGGGKSICFQVPAIALGGTCLVISPLIALMQDQVANLQQKGIPAVAIHSGLKYHEVRALFQEAAAGRYQFIYLSPERLETQLFEEYFSVFNIRLLVVDEAHCVSQWGYDFRPPYLRIAKIRDQLPKVPLLALTASATPMVCEDIIDKLQLEPYAFYQQSFVRANLSYSVFLIEDKLNKLKEILQNVPGSAIVYCNARKQAKELAFLLQGQSFSADYYHAGLSQELRTQKQNDWIQNKNRIMVCTNAFGMGIDKPDVRTVIHFDIPVCLENYYQEAGRAGRDGLKAYAVLLVQQEQLTNLASLPNKRFPSIDIIKSVYQSLADFLQLPIGMGQGNYYDFDLSKFVHNFSIDPMLVANVLQVLEKEGHIIFSESIFLPSQVQFTCTKEELHHFESMQPQLEQLIKLLLRSYQGIFDNRVSIYEKQMAFYSKTNIELIQSQLKKLQAFGIIEYLPQKDSPQIHFLLNRAPAKYLHINQVAYEERKKQFTLRLETMKQYIQLNKDPICRAVFIGQYFGDFQITPCGVCDNCLHQKKKPLGKEAFTHLQTQIIHQIQSPVLLSKLLNQLSEYPKEHCWEVIEFLLSEEMIQINEEEWVSLVG